MIGADARTARLKDTVLLDDRRFVLTGNNCSADAPAPLNILRTNLLGVFAVGDVRSGSVKRLHQQSVKDLSSYRRFTPGLHRCDKPRRVSR
jgi:thioredoxin reductase